MTSHGSTTIDDTTAVALSALHRLKSAATTAAANPSNLMTMSHLADIATAVQSSSFTSSATGTTTNSGPLLVTPITPTTAVEAADAAKQHSNHNHTSRGPHKKRSADAAALTSYMTTSSMAATIHTASDGSVSSGSCGKTSPSSPNHNKFLSEDDKKAERRAANRRSAFQSRQRRKILIEDLQRTVSALSKDNSDLRKSNDDMRIKLEMALVDNQQLRLSTTAATATEHCPNLPSPQQQQLPTNTYPTVTSPAPPLAFGGTTAGGATGGTTTPPTTSSAFSQLLASRQAVFNDGSLSTVDGSVTPSPAETERLINAKLALIAAQNRVSELEMQQQQQQALAATTATRGGPAMATPAPSPWAALGLNGLTSSTMDHHHHRSAAAAAALAAADAAHLARIQELMFRTAPTQHSVVANPSSTSTELAHLRRLIELREHQAASAAAAANVLNTANPNASSTSEPPVVPSAAVMAPAPAPTSTSPASEAPGLYLLLESLRTNSGSNNSSVPTAAPTAAVTTGGNGM
jgi:hypothetical protein